MRDNSITRDLENRGKKAGASKDYLKASQLYFKAMEQYNQAGQRYKEKYCEGCAWYWKAMASGQSSVEECMKCADYFDNIIVAFNNALSELDLNHEKYHKIEANMRHDEANKYTTLANAEVKRARAESNYPYGKTFHLRCAADYSLSGAQSRKLASDICLKHNDMAGYYNRLGAYHSDLSACYYYRAWAETVGENYEEALLLYERAREERQNAIDFRKKSLELTYHEGVKTTLKHNEDFYRDVIDKIDYCRLQINKEKLVKKEPDYIGKPILNVKMEIREGMCQGLVSPISVVLVNNGKGNANNIFIELTSSFLEGNMTSSIDRLKPGSNSRTGLSAKPTEAGIIDGKINIRYEDSQGNTITQFSNTTLKVSKREESRQDAKNFSFNIIGLEAIHELKKIDLKELLLKKEIEMIADITNLSRAEMSCPRCSNQWFSTGKPKFCSKCGLRL